MSMEVRLLLAFLLMGVVMFVTPYFYKTPPPAKNAQKTTETQNEPGPAPTASPAAAETAAPVAPAASSAAPTEPATVAMSLPQVTIDTNLFRVTFSNQGATVRSWQLKKYKGNDNKPLELLNPAVASVGCAVSVCPLFPRSTTHRESQSGLLHPDAGCRRFGRRIHL